MDKQPNEEGRSGPTTDETRAADAKANRLKKLNDRYMDLSLDDHQAAMAHTGEGPEIRAEMRKVKGEIEELEKGA